MNFEKLAEVKTIDRADLDLFCYADDAESGWQELVRSRTANRAAAARLSVERY